MLPTITTRVLRAPEGVCHTAVTTGEEFIPDENGLVETKNPLSVRELLALGYVEDRGDDADSGVDTGSGGPDRRPGASVESLLGSSSLPTLVDVGHPEPAQLGTVVARAHSKSGMSVEAWNSLPEDIREELIHRSIKDLQAEADAQQNDGNNHSGDQNASKPPEAPDFAGMGSRTKLCEWLKEHGVSADPATRRDVLVGLCVDTWNDEQAKLNPPV